MEQKMLKQEKKKEMKMGEMLSILFNKISF